MIKLIKYRGFAVLLLFVINFAFADSAVEQRLIQLVNGFQSYTADFKQTTTETGSSEVTKASGKVYIQKPGLFRWEITSPNRQIIINDSRTLWVFDQDLMQVTQQSIKTPNLQNDPGLLLSGDPKIYLQKFRVSWLTAAGGWFQLKPKQFGAGGILIRLKFENDQLIMVQYIDSMNRVTLFQFTNIQLNKQIPGDLFKFIPPPGVTSVKQ